MSERPGEAEYRSLVLGAEVAAEEAAEELAVVEEVEVRRHPELVYGAAFPLRLSAQSANNLPLPFPLVSIAAPFLALPVTILVIRALLRSPRIAARLSRRTKRATGGTAQPPRHSEASASSPGSPPQSAPRSSSAASRRRMRSRRSSRGCTILFVAGLVDDLRALNPLAKLAAADSRRGCRPLQRASRWRSSTTTARDGCWESSGWSA